MRYLIIGKLIVINEEDRQIINTNMKKAVLLLFFLLVVLLTHSLNSQDLFYPEIEPILTGEQKVQLEKAVKILKKASGNENNANSIDRKYARLAQKGNKTDWEKKTWEAKQQRILAESNYQRAHKIIFDLYSEIITNALYATTDDETEALSLNDVAYSKFEEADAKLAQFRDISKEQLELTDYEGIKNNLTEIHNLQVYGIRDQISALEIFINKGVKFQKDKEDELAWEQAQKENTIASYHKYLDSHPRGKNMSKANNKIRALERNVTYTKRNNNKNKRQKNIQEQNNENNNVVLKENEDIDKNNNVRYNENKKEVNYNRNTNVDKGIIFKVQIAASEVFLTDWFISVKAQNAKEIETVYIDSWIKYLVGEFNSYYEAAKYRDILRSTAPDAFIVVFKDGNQIQITNSMKL